MATSVGPEPVSSTGLARTASSVVHDVIEKDHKGEAINEDLADLRDAVDTVARRSDSLTQFVDSYRQITRLAPPEKKRVSLADLFDTAGELVHRAVVERTDQCLVAREVPVRRADRCAVR